MLVSISGFPYIPAIEAYKCQNKLYFGCRADRVIQRRLIFEKEGVELIEGLLACWLGDWYKCQRMRGEWENIYSHLLFGFWAIEKEVEKGGGWEYKSGGGRGSVGESGRTLVGHLRCSSQTRVSVSQQEPPSPHIYLYTSYILHITKYKCIILSLLTSKLFIFNQVSALFLFLLVSVYFWELKGLKITL